MTMHDAYNSVPPPLAPKQLDAAPLGLGHREKLRISDPLAFINFRKGKNNINVLISDNNKNKHFVKLLYLHFN